MQAQPNGLAARWKYLLAVGVRPGRCASSCTGRARPAARRCTPFYVPLFKGVAIPLGAIGFIVFVGQLLIIVGFSNAVNLTDGLDGLAIMPTVLVASALGVFAYLSGNTPSSPTTCRFPAIPGAGELAIFCGAIAGAGLGFLWFNTYPAMVFMGDIGALALGAALGGDRGDRAPGNRAADHGRRVRGGNRCR